MSFFIVSSDEHSATVDLRTARHLDSTALAQLVMYAAKQGRAGKDVTVLVSSAAMQKIFHITGLSRHVRIEVRPAEAA